MRTAFQEKTPRSTKKIKLIISNLLLQVRILVTDLHLLCVPLCSFVCFTVYTVHENASDVLVEVRELSAGIVNPYAKLHRGRCLQSSPGPWHSRSASPEQGKHYSLKCTLFADLKKK